MELCASLSFAEEHGWAFFIADPVPGLGQVLAHDCCPPDFLSPGLSEILVFGSKKLREMK
jgi:hypothetical protein